MLPEDHFETALFSISIEYAPGVDCAPGAYCSFLNSNCKHHTVVSDDNPLFFDAIAVIVIVVKMG